MEMINPRNTTTGSNVLVLPAASEFSSHCPANKPNTIFIKYNDTVQIIIMQRVGSNVVTSNSYFFKSTAQ